MKTQNSASGRFVKREQFTAECLTTRKTANLSVRYVLQDLAAAHSREKLIKDEKL